MEWGLRARPAGDESLEGALGDGLGGEGGLILEEVAVVRPREVQLHVVQRPQGGDCKGGRSQGGSRRRRLC